MKKAFFAFVAVSAIVLSACNNKPAENTETTVDTAAVAPAEPVAAEPVAADSATVAADSTATPAAH
ncbi:MAG: hypothetical protein JST49_02830 [Bacteroidetes bacterium]|nr:hypothetical protein [Bacteroidota bacterium]